MLRTLLAGSIMALSGGLSAADEGVYTWKDGAGRVHYSNRRPEGHPVETVELNAKPVTVQPTESIYTWIDDRGKVHYGAKPPANFPVKRLKEEDSSLSTVPFNPNSVDGRSDRQPAIQDLQRRD
ncbi:MAG: DUF4124 domain-containing protein [Candidatus Competibacteraceae bacterium]|nr:DUF4124 domain-containing protein [Candidatus Competibacteraceae bacterium]